LTKKEKKKRKSFKQTCFACEIDLHIPLVVDS